MTKTIIAVAMSVVVVSMLTAIGCSSESSNNEPLTTCHTRGDCGPGQECDTSSQRCVAVADVVADVPADQDTAPDFTADGDCICEFGQTCCDAACVNITNSATHCGACGHGCGAGQICIGSACACASGKADCDGDAANGCESSLLDDPTHCGGCDTTCGGDTPDCADGACGCGGASCTTLQLCCALDASRNACVDLFSNQHCGGCGNVCAPGTNCINGQCICASEGSTCTATQRCCPNGCVPQNAPCACGTTTCAAAESCCGDTTCADLLRDSQHCGDCDTACGPEQTCSFGSCICELGLYACGTQCVDLHRDVDNCGACGTACGAGMACCDGACVDTLNDADDCGGCGFICGATCLNGQCTCNGYPIDLATDQSHCGACGVDCKQGPNVRNVQCTAGVCSFECGGAWLDCDAAMPGCETSSRTQENCGGCAQVCPVGTVCDIDRCECGGRPCDPWAPNAVDATCTGNTCLLTCADGWADCDTKGETGCEANLTTDPQHCGTCDVGCGFAGTCVDGLCR